MVEAQNYTLMNLFVAATRLHTSTHRSGVLTAIREILSDLIGSAASAVFEIDASGKTLSLLESSGIAAATLSHIPIGSGCIGRVAATGEPFFGDGTDGELIACVPLKLGPRVIGVIALFRLLDQKVELHSNDHELLDFMSTHAALALHRTAARTGSDLPSGAVS
jgi:GAF domain-containing protein